VVFLPGAGDVAQDFVDRGFVEQLHREVVADAVAANATTAYHRDGSVVRRVFEDVLAPARQDYEHVWLVGVSMGGGAALRTAAAHPEDVDGVVLLAPFLGSMSLARRIARAGGPARWEADPAIDDVYLDAWAWAGEPDREAPIVLAYGRDDLLARVGDALALGLPESQVFRGGGGHTWEVWGQLWRAVTEAGFLQRTCGAAP